MSMVAVLAVAVALVVGGGGWLVAKRRSRHRMNQFLKDRGGKACPKCSHYVSQVALVCRNCGHRFDL